MDRSHDIDPILVIIVVVLRYYLRILSTVLLATTGITVLAEVIASPSGQRPIDSFDYQSSVVRANWVATKTPSGRIFAQGAHGLVELVGGRWLQSCSDVDYVWDCLSADSEGRIWAAGTGEIGRYDPDAAGMYHYRSLTNLLSESDRAVRYTFSIFPDASGRMVFIGEDFVIRTDGASAQLWHIESNKRLAGWIDNGRIFIGNNRTRVFVLEEEGPRPIELPERISGLPIFWSERLGQDDWIAAVKEGLISGQSGSADRFEAVNRWLGKSMPTWWCRTAEGRLAIATYTNGLFLVDTGTGAFERIGEPEGLLSQGAVRVFGDETDWLWVVTLRGLNRVSTSEAVSFVPNGGGFDGAMLGFADVDGDSALLMTQAGCFELPVNGQASTPRKTSDNHFYSAVKIGSSYLGGSAWGLLEFDRNERRKVIQENMDVYEMANCATASDVVYYAVDRDVRAIRRRAGNYEILTSLTMPETIQSICEDRVGDVWVATNSEVGRFSVSPDRDRFVQRQMFPVADPAQQEAQFIKLFQIGGEVFLVQDGRLLEVSEDGSFRTVPMFQGADLVDAVTSDGESWALIRPRTHEAESPRLVRLSLESGNLCANPIGTEGLLSSGQLRNLHSVNVAPGKNEIWIGTDNGLLRIKPELTRASAPPPTMNPTIDRIEEGKVRRIRLEDRELPYGAGSVSLGWSAPGVIPADFFVETRLVGANEHWVSSGDTTSREFSGLGDGSYRFEVRTVDALGKPGPVSTASFVVLPPWYRTPIALTGFLVTALVLGWASWQYKSRAALRRAEQLEGMVEERTRELELVNTEKTRFIARMNHEIRNPLNGLLGAIGVLEQYAHSGREGRMMDILRTCADHLSAVVEDVLDFSSIEGGRIVLQERAYSVEQVVETVPRIMLAESERTGTEVVTRIAPDMPPLVVGDPDRIRQILVNFLGNALKYAPGEPVHIEASLVANAESPCLRFAVRDHGPGISEADKAALFSMFERGRSASKRNVRGMGIGLATCRLLARRMGGEVGVISGLGEGSEFFLRLPLKVAIEAEVADAAPVPDLHKLSCLIIEDEDFNRDILKDMLVRLGCTVDEAADAEAGLSLAAMNRYDVVFTDLELPDAAPGEILKHLIAQQPPDTTTRPALVVTTAYATENVRQTCVAAGAQAFLAKPLSQSKVLDVLREIDSARRPAGSTTGARASVPKNPSRSVIGHLARIRGCGVSSVAAEIARSIAEEIGNVQESSRQSNVREVAKQAHRILSLATLADSPALASAAVRVQNEAREGRLPSEDTLAALAAGALDARERLSSLSSAGEG